MLAQVHERWRGCHFFRAACLVQIGHPATQFCALTSCSPTAVTNLTRNSHAWRPIFVAKADPTPRQQGFRGRGIWFFADRAFVHSLFVDLKEFPPFVTCFTMPSFSEEKKGKEKKI